MNAPKPPTRAELRARRADALVAAAKRGDKGAFERLIVAYRPRIYAMALHLTGQHSDAEDVTQDAFMRAYTKIAQFEGRSAFFTWLYRIAMNGALNRKRNSGRRPVVSLHDPRLHAALSVDGGDDPSRRVELRQQYQRLLAAFDTLSDTLRTTLVLTTLQGLSYKEAAVVLGTTEGTVAWRVHEARRKLRICLDEQPTSDYPSSLTG